MSSDSSKKPDPAALQRALAELRERLEKHQTLVLEGFSALRHEIDAIGQQAARLAEEAAFASDPLNSPTIDFEPPSSPDDETIMDIPKGIPVGKAVPQSQPAAPVGRIPDPPTLPPTANPTAPLPSAQASTPASPKPGDFDFLSPKSHQSTSEPPHGIPTATPVTTPLGQEPDMEPLIFGLELAANQSLHQDRQALLQGLYGGEAEAITLLGQILIFRGATPDRMPGLLKEVGEAYYRWRPETAYSHDPFREELTGWLQRKFDEAGVPNTIELVQPGDRYDSKRHHTKDRGVEVDEVLGWVVLRDNGKVYTKASVSLK